MREEIKNTKKLDNKGFSLIELIIVIAIMAILIGIVGTQVVPYIEKSKQAKDQQVISGLLTNATTAFASNAEAYDSSGTQDFLVGGDCSSTGTITGNEKKVSDEFYSLAGLTQATAKTDLINKMSSKAGKDITDIKIERDANGVVKVTVTVSDTAKYGSVFDVLSST